MKDMMPSNRKPMNMETAKYVSEAMDDIFDILKGFYTGYGTVLKTPSIETAIRQQWIYELNGSGVDEEMLRTGMSRAKAHSLEDKFCKWPSIMDFISWCHGIPSPEAAYYETARNCHDLTEWEPTHPIVALAGREVTFVAIRHSEDKKLHKTEYIRVFCELLSRVLDGEVFEYRKKEKPLAIESKPKSEEELARGRQKLEELKAIVSGGEEKAKREDMPMMTEEEKQRRMADMRAKAEAWKASRGEK